VLPTPEGDVRHGSTPPPSSRGVVVALAAGLAAAVALVGGSGVLTQIMARAAETWRASGTELSVAQQLALKYAQFFRRNWIQAVPAYLGFSALIPGTYLIVRGSRSS
jgi:hypothetical protein